MPLCAPKKVPLNGDDWVTLQRDPGLVLQKRPVSAKNKKESFRILMRCNNFVVGEFSEEKETLRMWDVLHDADPAAFDTTGEVAVQKMLQAKMSTTYLNPTQPEEEFQEQSNYMACVMSIVEIVKSLPDRAELADIKDVSSMVGVLSSLSRQLAVMAKQLSDKRIVAKKLSYELHSSMYDDWVSLPGKEEKVSAENKSNGATSPASVLSPAERRSVNGLVEHVNKLFELSSRRFSTTEGLLKEIEIMLNSSESPVANSDVYNSSVYYIPIVDSINKTADSKWLKDFIEERKSGPVLADHEYDALISSYLQGRVIAGPDSNPLGRSINSAITKYSTYLSALKSTPLFEGMTEETMSNMMQNLRADITQFADLMAAGLKLSFPTLTADAKFIPSFKRAVQDVVISLLHPTILPLYHLKLSTKDDAMSQQCVVLKAASPEVCGVDKRFIECVSAPGALQPAEDSCKGFTDTVSVRTKLHHLEKISSSLFSLAAVQLKKLALEKKKPAGAAEGESSPDNLSISGVDDVMKYSIGADDFLPLLTYTLIQLNIPKFYSDLLFVADFIDESMLLGKAGYLLASAQTSIQYIVSIHYDPVQEKRRSAQASEDLSTPVQAPASPAPAAVTAPQSAPSTPNEKTSSQPNTPTLTSSSSKRSLFGKRQSSGRTKRTDSGKTESKDKAPASPTPAGTSASTPKSYDLSSTPRQALNDNDGWVLNRFSIYQGEILESETAYHFSQRLYSLIISIFHRFKHILSSSSTNTNKKAHPLELVRDEMRSDDIYAVFKQETTKLQRINVESLSDREKLVFFLNVYHALLLHGCIEKEWPDSDLARVRQQQTLAYDIGGVECTLLEIEHGILRHKTTPPDIFGASLFVKRWKNSDWNKKHYALDFAEPLLSFVISTISVSGPALRVYHADPNLDQTMAYATAVYLDREIIIDEEKGEIHLPRVLEWYKKDFGRNSVELLQWVSKWLPKTTSEKFNALAAKKKLNNLKVKFKPYSWDFRFDFHAPPEDSDLEARLPVSWAPKSKAK